MRTISRYLALAASLILLATEQSISANFVAKVRINLLLSGRVNYARSISGQGEGTLFSRRGLEPQLIQMSSTSADHPANIAGELDGSSSYHRRHSRYSARRAPLVIVVALRRPLFGLSSDQEYRSVKELKGKVLGISRSAAANIPQQKACLAAGGLDAEASPPFRSTIERLLQALVTSSIQITALSPAQVSILRDKFKMNILDSALERFARNRQRGLSCLSNSCKKSPI